MILSLEQILIDIEIYHMNRQAHRGIQTSKEKWLEEVIESIGPAGNFLAERSTVKGIRAGTWLVDRMGVHEPFNAWQAAGQKSITDEAREKVSELLATHRPLPFSSEVEQELEHIHQRANVLVLG
jgi:trimethylamine--corrinoid protein Co-methyltransferase